MSPLSGTQVHLSRGDHRVALASIGASLRSYTVNGSPIVVPFAEDEVAPAFHGMVLAPWPNRLADGQYAFGGRALQVPITEPARNTALHGLACWDDWSITEQGDHAAELSLDLPAQPGYPFALTVTVRYELVEGGLTITTTARNGGSEALPYGVGFHPWFSPGAGSLDDCTLQLDAGEIVTVDQRLLPTGTAPVAGDADFRAPKTLAGTDLDDAWVGAIRDPQGRSGARLTRGDGVTVGIWMDDAGKAWQVCTGNHVGTPEQQRSGVAIEPMSCIADAFRTGNDLVTLEPGETHTLSWGIEVS